MANSGHGSGQGPVTDASPTDFERPLDGGLAQWAFRGGNWSRAAVDYERRRSQGSLGRRKDPAVHEATLLLAPVKIDPPAG